MTSEQLPLSDFIKYLVVTHHSKIVMMASHYVGIVSNKCQILWYNCIVLEPNRAFIAFILCLLPDLLCRKLLWPSG